MIDRVKMAMKMATETAPQTTHSMMKSASVCFATVDACSGNSGKSVSISIMPDAPCEA